MTDVCDNPAIEEPIDNLKFRSMSASMQATILGLVSAVGYTLTNICLRSVTEVDPFWVSCIKAIPTCLAALPFVLRSLMQSKPLFPSWKLFWIISIAGLVGQMVGNVGFQWALGIIGLALDVPIVMGTMIVFGALLGRWILNDSLSRRMLVAGAILIVAICVLAIGAEQARAAISQPTDSASLQVHQDAQFWKTVAGVAASAISGIAYCFLSIGIRYATNKGCGKLSTIGVVSFCGILSLGTYSFRTLTFEQLFDHSLQTYLWMFLAGVFNFIAFLALAKSLQLASVFFINALNATQIGMAALAGVVLFNEPPTIYLLFGILLTIGGLMFMKPARSLPRSKK